MFNGLENSTDKLLIYKYWLITKGWQVILKGFGVGVQAVAQADAIILDTPPESRESNGHYFL